MSGRRIDDVAAQYARADALQVRINTYLLYQERALDLDHEAGTLLKLNGSESVLDVGCGPGRFLQHLRETGHRGRLTGLDQSAGMVAELAQGGNGITGVRGNAEALPFPDNAFDVVVARHMLYHVDDIQAALHELRRVSAGTVLVSTGSRYSTQYLDGMLARVVEDFGYSARSRVMARFCTENAAEWFATAGMQFDETFLTNALVFREPQPIVDYVLSCLPSFGIMPGSERYAETAQRLELLATGDLAANGGIIRDTTSVGLYLVRK